jgi:hypothetical protein
VAGVDEVTLTLSVEEARDLLDRYEAAVEEWHIEPETDAADKLREAIARAETA